MKIYTKRGDKGETSLIGGSRVSKTHSRIEAYGTVDELNSSIGVIRDSAKYRELDPFLVEIQNTLFTIGSELASTPDSKMVLPKLKDEQIEELEAEMDRMDEELPQLKNFILPGGEITASHCHVSRCICRRAERRVVALSELSEIDERIVRYLNRLSDYLFTLARYYTLKHGGIETQWKTRN